MAYTLRVKESKKEYVQADNVDNIHILVEIMDGETVKEERSFGYVLGTTTDAIKEDLTKFIANYNLEAEQAIINKEHEEKQAQADETIAAMASFTV